MGRGEEVAMDASKIGVALWSLGGSATREDFASLLDTAAEIGVKGVQPWCVDVKKWNTVCFLDPDRLKTSEERAEARRMVNGRGLEISGFCAQLAGPETLGGFGEEKGLEWRVEKTKKALTLSAEMGAPVVTTHVGAIPEEKGELRERMLRSLGKIARHGEKVGAVLAVETGQETARLLKGFIEEVESPALRVNYDPANMLRHGTVEGVKVLAEYIVHTHAKDRDPATVGRGKVPWKEYLAALKEIGYDGWLAIEDESGEDRTASVRAGREYLERMLAGG